MKTSHLILILLFGSIIVSETVSHAPDMLALMIPIVIIVLFSPLGRAWANKINSQSGTSHSNNDYQELKNKYHQLESKLEEYYEEINKMRESIIFYESKKLNPITQEVEVDDIKRKINLEKQKDL